MNQKTLGLFFNRFIVILIMLLFTAAPVFSAGVRWHRYDTGLAIGKKERKKVFMYFWAEWCKFCEQMEKETLSKPEIVSYLNENFVAVKVNSDMEQRIAMKYFVRGLPTTWFLGERGEKISNLPGYVSPAMFLPILKYIHTDSYKKMSFKEFINKK